MKQTLVPMFVVAFASAAFAQMPDAAETGADEGNEAGCHDGQRLRR